MNIHKTAQLGDLIVAAFEEAAHYSTDPKEVSRLATMAVMHMWRRARMALALPSLPATS
jgi:hypothetical protein